MFDISSALKNYPVCQPRTGRHKQFTFMVRDKIYKGPYSDSLVQRLEYRSKFLKDHQIPFIVHPETKHDKIQTLSSAEGKFIIYPNLAVDYPIKTQSHEESFSTYSYQVLQRQNLIKLQNGWIMPDNQWILSSENIKSLFYALLVLHLLQVGDTGFFNILVDTVKQKIYIIDFDEMSSGKNERDNELFYLSKAPAALIAKKWLSLVRPFYPEMIEKMKPFLLIPEVQDRAKLVLSTISGFMESMDIPTALEKVLPYLSDEEFNSRTVTIIYLKNKFQEKNISVTGLKKKEEFVQRYREHMDAPKVPKVPKVSRNPKVSPGDTKDLPKNPKVSPKTSSKISSDTNIGKMKWSGGLFSGSTTFSGFSLDIMKSGLQKYIRRGMKDKAVMCAIELYRMIEVGGLSAQTNLFNRLAVIAAEDIGPANLPLVLYVIDFVDQRKKNSKSSIDSNNPNDTDTEISILVKIVEEMVSSPKTRMMSHLWRTYGLPLGREQGKKRGVKIDELMTPEDLNYLQALESPFWDPKDPINIQPYAELFYDRMLKKDRNAITWLSRYFDICYSEDNPIKIVPRKRRTDPALVIWEMMNSLHENKNWKKMIKILETGYFSRNDRDRRTFLMTAILAHFGDEITSLVASSTVGYLPNKTGKNNNILTLAEKEKIKALREGKYQLMIDEFIIDKHTAEGKMKGANRDKFTKEGALVTNQSPKYLDPILKEIYEM